MTRELKELASIRVDGLAKALQKVEDRPSYTDFELAMKCSRYREILKTMESLTKELSSAYFLQEEASC